MSLRRSPPPSPGSWGARARTEGPARRRRDQIMPTGDLPEAKAFPSRARRAPARVAVQPFRPLRESARRRRPGPDQERLD